MNLSQIIEVGLGLVVLYILLSTICSIAIEILSSFFGWRRQMLADTVVKLLTGQVPEAREPFSIPSCWRACKGCFAATCRRVRFWLTETDGGGAQTPAEGAAVLSHFWNHPLIAGLASPDGNKPSYVEPTAFSAALVDLLPKDASGNLPNTAASVERALRQALQVPAHGGKTQDCPSHLQEHLRTLFRTRNLIVASPSADADALTQFKQGIEQWYNEAMERLIGRYKRKTANWLFWIGLITATLLNADSIRVAYVLGTRDQLRGTLADYAETMASNTIAQAVNTGTSNSLNQFRHELNGRIHDLQTLQGIGFPIGWQDSIPINFSPIIKTPVETSTEGTNAPITGHAGGSAPTPRLWALAIATKFLGLLVTALAVSLGAPFWYDILNKLVSIRSAGRRPRTLAEQEDQESTKVSPPAAPRQTPSAPEASSALLSYGGPAPVAPPPKPADIGADLALPMLAFSERKGRWLAEAARLAYETSEAEVEKVVGKQWVFDPAVKFFNFQASDRSSVQAFLAFGPQVAILSFRSTDPNKIEDWLTDAKFKPKAWDPGLGCVHEGFAETLGGLESQAGKASSYAAIRDEIAKLHGTGRLLYITGHGLGAALATLSAARLVANKVYPVQGVYTFGSPRVGDQAFADAYGRALGNRTFRVVNNEDLVTRVPPRLSGYKHVGELIYFDANGNLQRDAGFWQLFLNRVTNAVEDFKQAVRTSVSDHSIELYLQRFRKLLREP